MYIEYINIYIKYSEQTNKLMFYLVIIKNPLLSEMTQITRILTHQKQFDYRYILSYM